MVTASRAVRRGVAPSAALYALLGLAACDRGAGNLTGQLGEPGAVCSDPNGCNGGLNGLPHVVYDKSALSFDAGPHQFLELPTLPQAPPLDAVCPAGEVVVGMVVALKLGKAPRFGIYLAPYEYPVFIAPRCASLNSDDSLGEAHTLEPLQSGDVSEADDPVSYDCPPGMAGVSVRGTLDREEEADTGEVWVSSLGLECVRPRAWFYGGDWSRSVILVGADGKMPFVNGCTKAVALLKGIGARADSRFRGMTNTCVAVGPPLPTP